MTPDAEQLSELTDAVAARVASWVAATQQELGEAQSTRADMLDGVRGDDDSFTFTRRLLESVVEVADPFAAAGGLRAVSRDLPETMPTLDRLAVKFGGLTSLSLPWAVMPAARRWLREQVSHLVLSTKLAAVGQKLRASGEKTPHCETLVALNGAAVLGNAGADREVARLCELAAQTDISAIAVDVARIAPAGLCGGWSLDTDAKLGGERLREVLTVTSANNTLLTLEVHSYRDALLAPELLKVALGAGDTELSDQFAAARIGITLAAELPESRLIAAPIIDVASARAASGAAPLEVTIAIAGLTNREQIASLHSGLAVPTLGTESAQAAASLQLLQSLLAHTDKLRVVFASEDAQLLAAASIFADRVDAGAAFGLQLRAGIADSLAVAIAEHGYRVRRRLPFVLPKEFAGAIDELVALAAQTAAANSPLALTRALLAGEAGALSAATTRLGEVLALAADNPSPSQRLQRRSLEWNDSLRDTAMFYRPPADPDRYRTGGLTAAVLALNKDQTTGVITLEQTGAPLRVPVISASGFANEPDTDALQYETREWARELFERAAGSDDGLAGAEAAEIIDPDLLLETASVAGEKWRELLPAERGATVARLALGMASARERLFVVLAAETGAPANLIDAQIAGTIDAARYNGQLAGALGVQRGSELQPDPLALITADAGVPLAERAEAMLAALATGSAVLLHAHPTVARSSAVLIEEWQQAGLPYGLVTLSVGRVDAAVDAAAYPGAAAGDASTTQVLADLASDERVSRALVLGRRETAQLLLRARPGLRVTGRFRAPGVVAVSGTAPYPQAVQGIVESAFAVGDADARQAKMVVLLGGAARSKELRRLLVDAVSSLTVGDTGAELGDPLAISVGPLTAPPSESGLRALTALAPGEEWLLQPKQLDDAGLLWQPGVRLGVKRDAQFWVDAQGLPVIGITAVHSIADAIEVCNEVGGGGVAALYATAADEIVPWLEHTYAASLSVGRPTTRARIERQPDGGWGAAGLGGEPLAGGPNRLLTMGSWQPRAGGGSNTLHLRGLRAEVQALIEVAQGSLDYPEFDRVRRAALRDALSWRTSLGGVQDATGLGIERNLLRHRAVSTHVRLAEQMPLEQLVRVLAAGLIVGAPMSVSTGVVLPAVLTELLERLNIKVVLELDGDWHARMAVTGPDEEEERIRLIGGSRARAAEWLGRLGAVPLWAAPVTTAGPIELHAFLAEQSISITAHRHGFALLPAGVGSWMADLQQDE